MFSRRTVSKHLKTIYFNFWFLGTAYWSQEAIDVFTKLCGSRLVQAEIKGYNKETNIPYVELYATDEHKKVIVCILKNI